MTLEQSNQTVTQVQAVRDRSLEEAYEVHDVGYEIITRRLQRHGFVVEDHGDDARHADEILYGDGPDLAVYRRCENIMSNDSGLGSTYSNIDTGRFVSHEDAHELVGYIEIKTKEKERWFGRCNRRHFDEYVNFSREVNVPVFIWFALVDSDENVCLRDGFFRVEDTDQINGEVIETNTTLVVDEQDIEPMDVSDDRSLVMFNESDIVNISRGDQIAETIPEVHGNEVVCLDTDQIRSTSYVLYQLIE